MAFKTITLRNLDSRDNENVVKILEAFMSKNDIKTGQTAIEEIIKDYDYMKKQNLILKTKIDGLLENNRVTYDAAINEKMKYKNVISHFQSFLKSLNEL